MTQANFHGIRASLGSLRSMRSFAATNSPFSLSALAATPFGTFFGTKMLPKGHRSIPLYIRILQREWTLLSAFGSIFFTASRSVFYYWPCPRVWSGGGYWARMFFVAILIGVCFTTLRFIEAPAMARVGRVSAWIRSRLPLPGEAEG